MEKCNLWNNAWYYAKNHARSLKNYVDFCHNFSSRRHITLRFVTRICQQLLLLVNRNLQIFQDIFENNQPYVSENGVKEHGLIVLCR